MLRRLFPPCNTRDRVLQDEYRTQAIKEKAKGNPGIAALYDRLLVSKELQSLGNKLRANYEETQKLLLQVAGHKVLLEGDLYLKQRLRLPDAYITTMNVCQAYTLKRIRDPDYHGVTTCRQYDMVPKLGPRREQHCHIRCFDNIISDVIVTIYHSSVDISMYHVGIRFFRDVNNNSSVVYVYL